MNAPDADDGPQDAFCFCARPTLPPTSAADEEARAFETLVQKVGEGQARWTRLLALLENGSEA